MKKNCLKESCGLQLVKTHFSVVKIKNKILTDVIILPNQELETLKLKNVAIALSDENVIAKILRINGQLSENEIEKHVTLESKYYFGYGVNELYFDFKILHHEKKQTTTYVLACKRKEVLEKILYFKKFKITPYAMDIESLAIARAVRLFCKTKCINYFYVDANKALFTVLNPNTIYCRPTQLATPIKDIHSLLKLLNQHLDFYLNLENSVLAEELILISDYFPEPIYLTDKAIHVIPLQTFLHTHHHNLFQKNNLTEFIVALGLALWK